MADAWPLSPLGIDLEDWDDGPRTDADASPLGIDLGLFVGPGPVLPAADEDLGIDLGPACSPGELRDTSSKQVQPTPTAEVLWNDLVSRHGDRFRSEEAGGQHANKYQLRPTCRAAYEQIGKQVLKRHSGKASVNDFSHCELDLALSI